MLSSGFGTVAGSSPAIRRSVMIATRRSGLNPIMGTLKHRIGIRFRPSVIKI